MPTELDPIGPLLEACAAGAYVLTQTAPRLVTQRCLPAACGNTGGSMQDVDQEDGDAEKGSFLDSRGYRDTQPGNSGPDA